MLRDKFAMAAMQEILHHENEKRRDKRFVGIRTSSDISKEAYIMADSMMKERANWDFSGDPDNVPVKVIGSKRPVPPEIETPPIKYE